MKRNHLAIVALVCAFAVSAQVCAQQFQVGDVFVSGSIPTGGTQEFQNKLLWYGNDGQLKHVLADSAVFDFGRLAFDTRGILYFTSSRGIETINSVGQITPGPFGPDTFRSLAFTADGSLLAGADQVLSRFGPSGASLNTFSVPDFLVQLDVASDQCTVYWVGPGIRRFDSCGGLQEPDFVTIPPFVGGSSEFRLLVGGGMAIARNDGIEIYNNAGLLLRKIGAVGGPVALDVDRSSIWVAEAGSLFKFDIATGNTLLGPIATGLTGFDGLTVYGEPRAAFVNGQLAGIPVLSRWMLLVLFAALGGVAILRLRM
ncbi:MAG TPA: hypothetical protein VNN08_06175 [Thermoanaerobaculia bacterium]|nr:hypothetical protein [Thermoanaerobaculia bacterium]